MYVFESSHDRKLRLVAGPNKRPFLAPVELLKASNHTGESLIRFFFSILFALGLAHRSLSRIALTHASEGHVSGG